MSIQLRSLLYILFIGVFASCTADTDHSTFDTDDWQKSNGGEYSYRDSMLRDLMENHLNEGMPISIVTKILGEPDNTEENYNETTLWYLIKKEDSESPEPGKMKTLFVDVNHNFVVSGFRVEEWSFN